MQTSFPSISLEKAIEQPYLNFENPLTENKTINNPVSRSQTSFRTNRPNSKVKKNKMKPEDLIQSALEIGKQIKINSKQNKKNRYYLSDLVTNTQITAKNTYMENLSKNFNNEISKAYKIHLDTTNNEALKQLSEKISEVIKVKTEYDKIDSNNKLIEYELSEINNNFATLNQKLLDKNVEINILQKKFESLQNISPLFENLIHEFPNEDMKELINTFYDNKEKCIAQIHVLNALKDKLYLIDKERKMISLKEKNNQQKIKEKIKEEESIKQSILSQKEKEFFMFQTEYERSKKHEEENIKLKEMLITLYKTIKSYIKDKEYENFILENGNDPLKSKKFNITIFNDSKFFKLVNDNIINTYVDCNDSKLLRITISFANYLSRKYLKQKKCYRYDPVNTFRDIKKLLDNQKFQNCQLEGVIKNLKQKQIDLKEKRKIMENLVQKSNLKYKALLKKLELAKSITSSLITNSPLMKNKRPQSACQAGKRIFKKTTVSSKPKKITIENNNYDKNIELNDQNNDKKKKKFFITHAGIFKKTKNSNKNKEENENNKKILTHENIESAIFKNVTDKNKRQLILNAIKHFKDLKISKNHDKLYKTNGFNSSDNILLSVKELLNEIFQADNYKFFSKCNLDNDNINDNKLVSEKSQIHSDTINKNTDLLKKKNKRPYTATSNCGEKYDNIANKVLNEIDDMISKIKEIDMHNYNPDDKSQYFGLNVKVNNFFDEEKKNDKKSKKRSKVEK